MRVIFWTWCSITWTEQGEGKPKPNIQPTTGLPHLPSLATKNLAGIRYGILATLCDYLSGIHSSLTTARPCNLCCILGVPGDTVSLASGVTKLIYRVFPINTKTMEAVANSEEDLELRFQRAAARMRSNTSLRLSNDQKLQLYGYFKQV